MHIIEVQESKKVNQEMVEDKLKDLHQPWAGVKIDTGLVDEEGNAVILPQVRSHGKQAYHPYTKLDFKHVSSKSPEGILKNFKL